MIIDIGHIGFNAHILGKNIQEFQSKGLKKTFCDHVVVNQPEKLSLLRNFTPTHEIVMMRSQESGIPIELVRYTKDTPSLNQGYLDLKNNFTVRAYTSDMQSSRIFWSLFGFEVTSIVGTTTTMTWRAPLQGKSYVLFLEETSKKELPMLDNKGFSFIAFVCNSIEKEWDYLQSPSIIEKTSIATTKVNGQMIDFFFIRNRGGEIVEIFNVKK